MFTFIMLALSGVFLGIVLGDLCDIGARRIGGTPRGSLVSATIARGIARALRCTVRWRARPCGCRRLDLDSILRESRGCVREVPAGTVFARGPQDVGIRETQGSTWSGMPGVIRERENLDPEEYDEGVRMGFRDPGGRSALRRGARRFPCPTCGRPRMLSAADVAHGYQCDACADRDEGLCYESRTPYSEPRRPGPGFGIVLRAFFGCLFAAGVLAAPCRIGRAWRWARRVRSAVSRCKVCEVCGPRAWREHASGDPYIRERTGRYDISREFQAVIWSSQRSRRRP